MASLKVLLLGATGETGRSLLDGLLNDGDYEVSALVREASLEKTAVKALQDRGILIVVGDSSADVPKLIGLCKGFDIVISAIDAMSQLAQVNLVDAAAAAGVKRFVPCGWATIAPRGGILNLRDQKEEVQDRIQQLRLPYTLIDCGFWHVFSFPSVPSGKLDYAQMAGDKTTIYAEGSEKTLLSHLSDIGKWVARILKDERTLNKRVVIWSDELSQNEIFEIIEDATGEKVERKHTSAVELADTIRQAQERLRAAPSTAKSSPDTFTLIINEYNRSKYVRGDNCLENAKYLGYLDAKELYPDFKPVSFSQFVTDELVQGKVARPYPHLSYVN